MLKQIVSVLEKYAYQTMVVYLLNFLSKTSCALWIIFKKIYYILWIQLLWKYLLVPVLYLLIFLKRSIFLSKVKIFINKVVYTYCKKFDIIINVYYTGVRYLIIIFTLYKDLYLYCYNIVTVSKNF